MNRKLATLTLCLQWSLTTFGADFNEIVRNPEKFHNKRVTVVAKVQGEAVQRFYLYRPPTSPNDTSRQVYGIISRESPLYEEYSNKWVRVTGVVDASFRGLLADSACSLIIERVRPMPKARKPELSCGGVPCDEVKVSRLLKAPKTYQGKCVWVTGFAHVRGDAFVIYESEKASGGPDPDSSTRDFKKGIFVSQRPSDTTNYDRYNNTWIKIKGVVDLSQRGFADYPAGVVVDDVQSASPPRPRR